MLGHEFSRVACSHAARAVGEHVDRHTTAHAHASVSMAPIVRERGAPNGEQGTQRHGRSPGYLLAVMQ